MKKKIEQEQKLPIGFRGFPCEGIFLVHKGPYCEGYSCICKLSDLRDLHIPTLAAMSLMNDEALKALRETQEKTHSNQDIINAIFQAVAKGCHSPEDRGTDKFMNNL